MKNLVERRGLSFPGVPQEYPITKRVVVLSRREMAAAQEQAVAIENHLRQLDIFDQRTPTLCRAVLERLDPSRERALRSAVCDASSRSRPSVRQMLADLGFQRLSEADAWIATEAVLDLSDQELAPAEKSEVHYFPPFHTDHLCFVHCTEVEVRNSHTLDPVLPLPKNEKAQGFVRRVLPVIANVLRCRRESRSYYQSNDSRRLRALREAGKHLATLQSAIEDSNLPLVDHTSALHFGRCLASEIASDPTGRHAMVEGYRSELPKSRLGAVAKGFVANLLGGRGSPR